MFALEPLDAGYLLVFLLSFSFNNSVVQFAAWIAASSSRLFLATSFTRRLSGAAPTVGSIRISDRP